MAIKCNASLQKTRSVKKRTALLASVFLLLCACGDGEEAAAPKADAGREKIAAPVTQTSASNGSSVEQCLVDNSKTPCNILDGEISARFAPERAQLNTDSREFAGNVSCRIHWDGGRTMDIGGAVANGSLTVPASDEVVFGEVQTDSDGVHAAAKKFEASYLTPGAGQRQGLLSEVNFEPVDDLGDAAVWGGTDRVKTLVVRVGASRFEVRANLSDNVAANRESAIRLAQSIIAYCQ